MKCAIHSVFIARENILFLEEWIDYHIQIGFDKFYLYDNSKVVQTTGFHAKSKTFTPGKVNKYGVNYADVVKLSTSEINSILSMLCAKYHDKIILSEWSPIGNNGLVTFNQEAAHRDCLQKLKKDDVTWCANIDIDEFIVLSSNIDIKQYITSLSANISCVILSQIRFESRFEHMDKRIIEINKAEASPVPVTHSNKLIYKVSKTTNLLVHRWYGEGISHRTNLNIIWFNHYKKPKSEDTINLNNINLNIFKKIKKNAVDYIKVPVANARV